MPAYVKDGGTWRTPDGVFARVGGVWTRIDTVYTRVGGVWVSSFVDRFDLVIASNINSDINLRSMAVSAGWNEIATVVVTINAGVVISGSGYTNAVTVDGVFPNGITLINNGYIIARGGSGGAGGAARGDIGVNNATGNYGTAFAGSPGGPGGTGLYAAVPVTVFNNGMIAGGGGGGGGAGAVVANVVGFDDPGGGGGGGGK